jgi:hypothetical protein
MQVWVTSKMVYQIRNDAMCSVLRQSPAFFNSAKTGELMQTVTAQTSVVQRNGMMLLQTLAQRPLTIVSILVVLFAQDWFFTLMSLVVFPACLTPIIRIGKRVRKMGAREEYDSRALSVAMVETFSGIRLVKSYAREDHAAQRFERTNASMTRNMVRWTKAMELVGPVVETVASFGIAAGPRLCLASGPRSREFLPARHGAHADLSARERAQPRADAAAKDHRGGEHGLRAARTKAGHSRLAQRHRRRPHQRCRDLPASHFFLP